MKNELENYETLHESIAEIQKAKIAYKEAISKLDEFISNTLLTRTTDDPLTFNQMREYSRAYYSDAKYSDQNDIKWQRLIVNLSSNLVK